MKILGWTGLQHFYRSYIVPMQEKLTNVVTKSMMSNQQINNTGKVPTSALAYSMQQSITKLNNDLIKKTYTFQSTDWKNPTYTIEVIAGVVYIHYHALVSDASGKFEYGIATLPSAVRPKKEIKSNAWCADGMGERIACSIKIKTTGSIHFIAAKAFVEAGFTIAYPL